MFVFVVLDVVVLRKAMIVIDEKLAQHNALPRRDKKSDWSKN